MEIKLGNISDIDGWGAPAGIAARAFYKRLGFTEGKLTEEFGSPVQEFVLKR